MRRVKYLVLVAALMLVIAACSDDDAGTTTDAPSTTEAPATTQAPATTAAPATTVADEEHTDDDEDHADDDEGHDEAGFQLDAPVAAITVDLDISDWDAVPGLDLTLEGIESESVDSKDVTLKVAHDDEFLYVLLAVQDDYNWNAEDPHLSASNALLWAIDDEAGPHMGTEAEGEEEEYESLGMVDIWHWELECGFGVESGGAVSESGADKSPGNDAGCNFDDEYSTDPETREDDDSASGENSLLGVWMHTNPVDHGDGTWYFEMSRPLQTGDPQDAQFAVGQSALLALAYWDADNSPEGWDDAEHVQSSSLGWIEVTLIG